VRVVEVEVADQEAVDERRPLDAAAAAAEQRRARFALHALGAAAGDGVGVGVHRADGGGGGNDEAALRLVGRLPGQGLRAEPALRVVARCLGEAREAQRAGVVGQTIGGGGRHRQSPARANLATGLLPLFYFWTPTAAEGCTASASRFGSGSAGGSSRGGLTAGAFPQNSSNPATAKHGRSPPAAPAPE